VTAVPLLSPESLGRLIADYAALGIHRTGWPADDATSAWIVGWLARHGVAARAAPFTFPKVECRAAYVEAGGMRIEGVPLHDGGATGPAGVTGPLAARAAGPGRIALLERPGPDDWRAALEPRSGESALAAVAVTGDPEGCVTLRNAERILAPYALPVLQVARRDAAPLTAGANARLVIDRDVVTARATNVVADVPAPGGDGLVVLMTPKSGWFACAAERGAGIAITMALAAGLAALPARRRHVRVLFTSGHELGHRGLLEYLDGNRPLRDEAALWIHLGASIGARFPVHPQLFSREERWRKWLPAVLARHGALPVEFAGRDVRPGGEARDVFDRPFVSLAGHHTYFHSPRDVPEVAVDAASVARFGVALAELVAEAVG
jgi:hypothetical protein